MPRFSVRPVRADDYEQWRPLWDAYNGFYGRSGPTALDDRVTAQTWQRFLDPDESMHALVAVADGRLVAIAHFLFHRSTSRLRDVCLLQDLFTAPAFRGRGVGGLLIESVVRAAKAAQSSRLYWTTQETNTAARALYDAMAEYRGFVVYSREL